VPPEERQFSLVLALLATGPGLTKAQILSTVHGYSQETAAGGDRASLERKFERDKDDLRTLGIPVETIDDPSDPGNNQHLRYRIPRAAYELPADVTFSPDELALLALGAMAWRDGSLSDESRRALTKLRSLGVTASDPVIGLAPLVRARDAAFGPLSDAIDAHVIVEFDYRKPGEHAATRRRVSPLALVNHEGRWHLVAAEGDAPTRKTFLLRRIVSAVRAMRSPAIEPLTDESARAIAELRALHETGIAVVEVVPGSDAALRLRNRPATLEREDGALEVHFTDLAVLADELVVFGHEVTALHPPALVESLMARLTRIAAEHAGPGHAGPEHAESEHAEETDRG
jgi:proteasome accessory factor B